jgi:hypothetical protein
MRKENGHTEKTYAIKKPKFGGRRWLTAKIVLLAMFTTAWGQDDYREFLAFNAKMTKKSNRAKPVPKNHSERVPANQSEGDSKFINLNAQLTIDLFQREHSKLTSEMIDLLEKTGPEKKSSLTTDETNLQQTAILRVKLESLETAIKTWLSCGDF